MKKFFKVIFLILGIAAAFALGFGSKLLLDSAAQTDAVPEDAAPVLRVYDSTIQWSDGVRWHIFGDADTLTEQDPIALAAQKLAEAQAAENAATDVEADAEEAPAETVDGVLALNRGTGSVATYYSGGGGGGSDGQDIAWSGDYL